MSDGAKLEMTNWDAIERVVDRAIDGLADRRAIEGVLVEAAAPMVADIRGQIGTWRPWRERGYTASTIKAAPGSASTDDAPCVDIGAPPGPNVTLRMLERGTSKLAAQAPLRKSYDRLIAEVRARAAKGLLALTRLSK